MKSRQKTPFSLRLNPDVHRAVSVAAARAGKSMNEWCADLLRAGAGASEALSLMAHVKAHEDALASAQSAFAESVADAAWAVGVDFFELRQHLDDPDFLESCKALLEPALAHHEVRNMDDEVRKQLTVVKYLEERLGATVLFSGDFDSGTQVFRILRGQSEDACLRIADELLDDTPEDQVEQMLADRDVMSDLANGAHIVLRNIALR